MADDRYRFTILRAGRLLLDGGGMFGIIPRVVWQRAVDADEKHRITLAHNCVLLEHVETGAKYLIETGTGDKLDAKMSGVFGLDGGTIDSALRAADHDPADISAVVLTHLHFDHAGGLTRRPREGEDPDWIATEPGDASGDSRGVKLTFPNARIIVQEREWEDAINNDAVMTKTYYRDHLLPLEKQLPSGRPRLDLHESPPPFDPGRVPHRGEKPASKLESRTTQVLPGVEVFRVPGHTWGQQAVLFHDQEGKPHCFAADLIPTRHHVGAAYSLSYDVEPYTAMITKHWFLTEAAERGWTLILDHEPGEPCFTVEPDGRGWWSLVPAGPNGH